MDLLLLIIFGFVFGFSLAFGIGANVVANTFATTVGSGAISMTKAFILASFCEIIGAVLLGGGVASALAKGIIDVEIFEYNPELLMLGYLSALIASTLWLIAATMFKMPVSGTQAAVGSVIGMGIAAYTPDVIHWREVITMILAWVLSPFVSGIGSAILYLLIKWFIFTPQSNSDKLDRCLISLPIFYFLTLFTGIFACFFGRDMIDALERPWWIPLITSTVCGVAAAVIVHFFYNPKLRAKVEKPKEEDIEMAGIPPKDDFEDLEVEPPKMRAFSITQSYPVEKKTKKEPSAFIKFLRLQEWADLFPLFWTLQILVSCFGSLAHGGNDVANAVAPILGMWEIYETGAVPAAQTTTYYWILAFGGVGISAGLWALGKHIIETIGTKMAVITPPKSFSIELGTTLVVLVASRLHLPISTTFCKVGSVVFVGLCTGKNEISWGILGNVLMAWFFTLPVTIIISAGTMVVVQHAFYTGNVTLGPIPDVYANATTLPFEWTTLA